METAPSDTNNGLLFANFNQDFGCFVSVTGRGFRIFNSDPLREKEARSFPPGKDSSISTADAVSSSLGGVAEMTVTADATLDAVGKGLAKIVKAEMLFRCNYVALVIAPTIHPTATQSPESNIGHKVVIWDDLKQRGVIQLEFNAEVRAVRLRRDRIVVVSKTLIKVFTFTASPQQLHVFDTAPNWRGLCSLSPSSANSLLAFPSPECDIPNVIASNNDNVAVDSQKPQANKTSNATNTSGNVKLIDLADTDKQPIIIPAHTSKLTCLMLNIQGTRLATTSDKGTLIRIFNTHDGNLLTELRRGSQPATIYSINFSPDSSLLVASSSHGTIHVFSADDSSRNKTSSLVSTATAMVGNLFGSSTATHNASSVHSKSGDSGSNSNTVSSGNTSNFGSKFVPKYFTSEWSFSRIEVPGATKCIVAFTQNHASSTTGGTGSTNMAVKNNFGIMAVCADGSYHKFVYDERKEDFTRDNYHMFVESDSK